MIFLYFHSQNTKITSRTFLLCIRGTEPWESPISIIVLHYVCMVKGRLSMGKFYPLPLLHILYAMRLFRGKRSKYHLTSLGPDAAAQFVSSEVTLVTTLFIKCNTWKCTKNPLAGGQGYDPEDEGPVYP